MLNKQPNIEHLKAVEGQRKMLAAIITGVFMTPTQSEDDAKFKAYIASGIMEGRNHFKPVEDYIEEAMLNAMQHFALEQLEFEKVKAIAEGREESLIYELVSGYFKNCNVTEFTIGDVHWYGLQDLLTKAIPELEGDTEFWGGDIFSIVDDSGVSLSWPND